MKNTNAKEFEAEMPDAAKSIIKNSYVGDYSASRETVESGKMLINDVIKINLRGNFNMHGWASNAHRA